MVIQILYILVLWTKVASALEGYKVDSVLKTCFSFLSHGFPLLNTFMPVVPQNGCTLLVISIQPEHFSENIFRRYAVV